MGLRHANVRSILLAVAAAGFFAAASIARADEFQIAEVSAARSSNVADIKPGTIDFSDHTSPGAIDSETALTRFGEWAEKHPEEKKFLALFPAYTEPTVDKPTQAACKARKSPRSFTCTWRKPASCSTKRQAQSIFRNT